MPLLQLLHLPDIVGSGRLSRRQPTLLRLHLTAQLLGLVGQLILCLADDGRLLLLGLLDQIVRHALGGHEGLSHGLLGGFILLHLVHQHLHLALEHGVFVVKGTVIGGEHIQKLIHHRHVVAAEGGLCKYAFGNFLRGEHIPYLPCAFSLKNQK